MNNFLKTKPMPGVYVFVNSNCYTNQLGEFLIYQIIIKFCGEKIKYSLYFIKILIKLLSACDSK